MANDLDTLPSRPGEERPRDAQGLPFDFAKAIHADKIVQSTDADYDQHRLNQYAFRSGSVEAAHKKLAPSLIVYCSTEAQVMSAVRFAAGHGYSVVCRSGGHSYSGHSSTSKPRSMQIDVSAMKHLRFEGNIATAGPGVRLRQLINALIFRKLNLPHGICKDVALGGHLQSSAWGIMAGALGSGLDYVIGLNIVLADGSLKTLSSDDEDPTLFKAILGSSPGSWGIVTQYKLRCTPDSRFPHTRVMLRKYRYSKETMIEAVKALQNICRDQEARGQNDFNTYMDVGVMASELDNFPDIPFLGSLSNLFNFERDRNFYILIEVLWTGSDSGKLTAELRKKLFSSLDAIPGKRIYSHNLPLPLSMATSLASPYKNLNYRFHIDGFSCDHWLADDFIASFADNFEERRALANAYPRFQLGFHTSTYELHKFARANTLVWRNQIVRIDNWTFFRDSEDAEKVADIMRDYHQRSEKHWLCTNGLEGRVWMTPCTYNDEFTDLRDPGVAKKFFQDEMLFLQLRMLKTAVDPTNLFDGKGTIPPLSKDEVARALSIHEPSPSRPDNAAIAQTGVAMLFERGEMLDRLKRLAN